MLAPNTMELKCLYHGFEAEFAYLESLGYFKTLCNIFCN